GQRPKTLEAATPRAGNATMRRGTEHGLPRPRHGRSASCARITAAHRRRRSTTTASRTPTLAIRLCPPKGSKLRCPRRRHRRIRKQRPSVLV
ncbi:hypothetical protein E4U41_001197, partial [Claviceps citrina]